MPGASPSPRWPLPRFLQKGRAETVDCALVDGRGQPVAVTNATFELLDSEGVDVVVSTVASVSGNTATYALPSNFADAYQVPQNIWRERWTLDGAVFEREAHLCRVAPAQHVTAETLFRMHPQWRRQLPKSRTSTTYDEPIQDAWEEMVGRMLGDGLLPHRILNWWALATPHKYLAASKVCDDFIADNPNDNRWMVLGEKYAARYEAEYTERTKVQADNDEDGVADTPGQLESPEPQLFLTSIPQTWYPPGWTGLGGSGGWWR